MNSGHRLLKRILKLGFLLMMGASMIADAFSSQKLNVKLTPLVDGAQCGQMWGCYFCGSGE